MKTAISLPDELFQAGEALAKRLKLSRSEVYARALEYYVALQSTDDVTERWNAVADSMSTALDPAFARAVLEVLPKDEW